MWEGQIWMAGQGRAGQGRAGQGRAGQGRAGQGRAGQAGFGCAGCFRLHKFPSLIFRQVAQAGSLACFGACTAACLGDRVNPFCRHGQVAHVVQHSGHVHLAQGSEVWQARSFSLFATSVRQLPLRIGGYAYRHVGR
jgi:hypothetical protein